MLPQFLHPPKSSPYKTLIPGISIVAGTLVNWMAIAPPTHAVILGQYSFDNQTLDPTYTDLNVSLTQLGFGYHVEYPTDDGSPTPTGLAVSADTWDQSQNSPSRFYSFTISPQPDYQMTLETISLESIRNPNASAQFSWTLLASLDGGTTYATLNSFAVNNTWTSNSVSLSSPSFANISNSNGVTFRLYAHDASDFSDKWQINNLKVEGTAAPVPEPITIFGGLTALGFGTAIRRKYKRNPNDQINSITP